MKNHNTSKWLCKSFLTVAIGITNAYGADTLGIVGKNEWLFVRSEILGPADLQPTVQSMDLIGRINKSLVTNGIAMAVTTVPMKMRLYAQHLPDNIIFNDFMSGNYENMSKSLLAAGVTFIDLNTPFMSSPIRNSDTPLFYRLDGHWSYPGAMLAAETIKTAIDANPTLKKALNATPEVAYKMTVNKRSLPSKARELIALIPPNSPIYAPERYTPFNVARAQPLSKSDSSQSGITMVGSSSAQEWTGFLDMLRHQLQRDILNVSVAADKGAWYAMESYVRSDAFQNNPPKLLFWERAEYTMRAPPNNQNQDARFRSDNTEWLLRTSAWVQADCKPSKINARVMPTGLAANAANLQGKDVVTGPTNDNDFIEISFDKPIDKLDYLSVRTATGGSNSLVLEASGSGAPTRRFTMEVAGDGALHNLKTPLPSKETGYFTVRIFPGKSTAFVFKGLQVCRQPEDLLR
ncbi:MAG: hypothetical protein H7240_07110 [Glaciimonas sp.]|nr:hypothetical protein [Glaciimonas sp.]